MKHTAMLGDYGGTAALGVAALTLAVVTAWHWTTPETVPTVAAPAVNPVPETVSVIGPTSVDYREIAGWHLFGEPVEALSTAERSDIDVTDSDAIENLPPSAIALQVTGIVTSSTGAGARAVIMDEAGRQSENAIGDRLPGNVELYAIERARVVIRRDGVLETIALPQPRELMPMSAAPTHVNPLTSTP